MVTDPPDGRIPPLTPQARQRAAARAEARKGRGEADSYEDRSLYDRCISRGIPGSMMPAIYGNSYDITQGPGVVAIRYEMIHETRVIPLSATPHVSGAIRSYMGDARGRFEGNTLVVETTNIDERVAYRGASAEAQDRRALHAGRGGTGRMVDHARRSRHLGAAVDLRHAADAGSRREPPFEYACHEGNYAMFNLLSIARAEEAAAARSVAPAPSR